MGGRERKWPIERAVSVFSWAAQALPYPGWAPATSARPLAYNNRRVFGRSPGPEVAPLPLCADGEDPAL